MSTTHSIAAIRRSGKSVLQFLSPVLHDRWGRVALGILSIYVILGAIGPLLPVPSPHEPQQYPDGGYASMDRPSLLFPLGTTNYGYDVFSQTIFAFRTSLFVGLLAAVLVVTVGVNIGLVAGYYSGYVDNVLMGMTDLAYGLPFYPFAIILVAIFGPSDLSIAVVIALVFWRSIARITRSETLSLKERAFVKSSKAVGTSNIRIMYLHILPNLLPLILIYFVFAITWGILLEASLSFIGLGDPASVSWGLMLHEVFEAGELSRAWWWVLPPAICLWLFILSLYVVARKLEDNAEVMAKGGA